MSRSNTSFLQFEIEAIIKSVKPQTIWKILIYSDLINNSFIGKKHNQKINKSKFASKCASTVVEGWIVKIYISYIIFVINKQSGAVAHNPEVGGSKPLSAMYFDVNPCITNSFALQSVNCIETGFIGDYMFFPKHQIKLRTQF